MREPRILFFCTLLAAAASACSPAPITDAGDAPITTDATDVPGNDVQGTDVQGTDVQGDDVQGDDVQGTDAADAPATGEMFAATLSGAEENPPVATAATGTATLSLNAEGTMLTYNVTHNVSGAMMAHIHEQVPGQNGSVVIGFASATSPITGTAPVTPAQATALREGRYYINVHSTANAGGEVRGQITRPGETLWVSRMTGSQENPAVVTTSTGSAFFLVNPTALTVRWGLTTTATATAAHIHTGPAGINGPVAINLNTTGMASTGMAAITNDQITAIREGRAYANVHTALNTGGEVRGQITRPGESLYIARLSGTEEVPPVITTGSAGFGLIVDYAGTGGRYAGQYSGVTATMAHIHTGARGTNGTVVHALTLVAPDQLLGTLALSAADITALNAGTYYTNIHSSAHAGGEIRGQLGAP